MSLETIISDPRVTVRRSGQPWAEGRAVVYWMQRAQRGIDNPALDVAIDLANELRKPLAVFFGLHPGYPNSNIRHYQFLFDGLQETADAVARRGAKFFFRPFPDHDLIRFCEDLRACLVIGDENPMRQPESWRRSAAEKLQVPFYTVDADVIVPTALLGKEEYAARTIRPRIHQRLEQYLVPCDNPSVRTAWPATDSMTFSRAIEREVLDSMPIDRRTAPVERATGGTTAGLSQLATFLKNGLDCYDKSRNLPELDGTSRLSAYLHFGHLGPHTIALAVGEAVAREEARAAYLEELIVRRELAINYVRFNPSYDRLDGCPGWAKRTLDEALLDERVYVYSNEEFEQAETHDDLWNAAQMEMVKTGRMHGYMRMYWAKKILEWSPCAEEAFETAVRLNDRYQLDGRDPNGYAGIAWAIGGKHDRPWAPRRKIFGMIRYMAYSGCRRKFDVPAYIARVAEA